MPILEFPIIVEYDDATLVDTALTHPPDGAGATLSESGTLKAIDTLAGATYTLQKIFFRWLVTLPGNVSSVVNVWLIIRPTARTNTNAENIYLAWSHWPIGSPEWSHSFSGQQAYTGLIGALALNADNTLLLSNGNGSSQGIPNIPLNGYTGLAGHISSPTGAPTGVNEITFDKFGSANKPRLRVQVSQVQVPRDMLPSSGAYDYTAAITYSWTYEESNNSPQSRVDIIYKVNAGSWQTHTINTSNQNWTGILSGLAHGTLTYKLKLYDADGLPSPESPEVTITLGNPAVAPVIVSPANNSVVAVARPIVQITSADATRTAWRIRAVTASGSTLWSSGEIAGQGTSLEIGENLANNSAYSLRAQTKNADGVWSAEAVTNITTNFVLPPATTLNAQANPGHIRITPTTPAPAGGQPAASYLDIYRMGDDELVFRRVATGARVGEAWDDAHVRVGVSYLYYADTIGVNSATATGAQSASVSITRALWGEVCRVHFVYDPMGTMIALPMYDPDADDSWASDGESVDYAGRSKPQTIRGRIERETATFRFMMPADEGQWAEWVLLLQKLGPFCVRTPWGDMYIGDIPSRKRKRDLVAGNDVITLQLNSNSWTEDI